MPPLTASPLCPRCLGAVPARVEQIVCDACLATHHARCWHQAGGCSALAAPSGVKPPAAERPHRIRVKRHSWEPTGATERRRSLVAGLGKPAESVKEVETEFQPARWRPVVGARRPCMKCRQEYVITDPLEDRCSRCVQAKWWKIGIAFVVFLLWKMIF
jgi:hypothetical protein